LGLSEYAFTPSSEKIIYVNAYPVERLLHGWSGVVSYTITTDFFVSSVVGLTEGSLPLSSGEYYFNPTNFELTVRLSDDSDPKDSFLVVKYKMGWSDKTLDLSGFPYENFLMSTGSFKDEVDPDDLTGVSLSGKGSISLINHSIYWDQIYRRLFWDGCLVDIFVYNSKYSVNQKIYSGYVDSKNYSSTKISFSLKDYIEKLRDELDLPYFTDSDGTLSEDVLGTPKRRLYGRVDGAKIQSLDMTLSGYTLSGTYTGAKGGTTITHSGGDLYKELVTGDKLEIGEYDYTVDSVTTTTITITDEIEKSFTGETVICMPEIPYRFKNRSFSVAHHELFEKSTTIDEVYQLNRFTVNDIDGFNVNDDVYINEETRTIKRIVNDEIILETNLTNSPTNGDTVKRLAIQEVWYLNNELVQDRDYTYSNTTECKLTIDDEMEFNIAKIKKFTFNLGFTNTSRNVTGADLDKFFKEKDWILPSGLSTWYEISSVTETTLTLKIVFSGTTDNYTTQRKRPPYINDDSVITVNCFGKMDSSGNHIYTSSQVIQDIIPSATLNQDSFDQAHLDAPYLVSLKIPFTVGDNRPMIRDIVNKINKSSLGALFKDLDQKITYRIMRPNKSLLGQTIYDEDVLNYSIQSTGKNIIKTQTVHYRSFDADKATGKEGTKTIEKTSSFISNISTIEKGNTDVLTLYNTADANIMAQRLLALKENSNTVITINAKLAFIGNVVTDPIFLKLSDIPYRASSSDKNFVGFISYIEKSGSNTKIKVTDLAGFFDSIACIAPSGTNDYDDATEDEKALHGFITDEYGVMDSNSTQNINLIG